MFEARAIERKSRQQSLLSLTRDANDAPETVDSYGSDAPSASASTAETGALDPKAESLLPSKPPQEASEVAASSPPPAEMEPSSAPAAGEPSWRERLFGRRSAAPEPRRAVAEERDVPPRVDAAPAPSEALVVAQPLLLAEDQETRPLLDPALVLAGVWRVRYLALALGLLGAMVGVAIALSTPKRYEAYAELLIDPRDLQLVEREVAPSGLPSDATIAIVENQMRVLTSGTVLGKVAERLKLAEDPEFNGEGSGGFGIGSPIAMLRALLSSGDGADDMSARTYIAIENLARSIDVSRSGNTFVISVGATTHSAEKSALFVNTLTEEFVRTAGALQSDTAGRAAEELTARLDELRADVEEAERKVEAFKAENDIIDAQGRLITDDEIVALNAQLTNARARTLDLNARAASAREVDLDDVLAGALPEQISSAAMTALRAQYAELKQRADSLSTRLGPRHPERAATEAQLAGVREQIQQELRRIASSLQVELRRAVQLEQELASRLAQLKVRQGGLGNEMVTLRELERDATAKRAVYESFLLRARETGEQQGINTANISIISPAYPPLLPSGPSRALIVVAGLMLGLMSGLGWGMVRGAHDSLRASGRPVWTPRGTLWRRQTIAPPPAHSFAASPFHAHAPREAVSEQSMPRVDPSGPEPSDSTRSAASQAAPGDDIMTNSFAPPAAPAESPAWPAYAAYPQPLPPHPALAPYMYPPQRPAEPGMVWVQAPAYGAWQHPSAVQPFPPQPAWHPAPPVPAPAPAAAQAQKETEAADAAGVADDQQASLDEIRASLREFREAIRELTESRQRRRYF